MVSTKRQNKVTVESKDDSLSVIKKLRKTNPIKAKALLKKLKKKRAKNRKKEKEKRCSFFRREEDRSNETEEQVEYIKEDIDKRLAQDFGDVYKRFGKNTENAEDSSEEMKENNRKINFEDYYSGSSYGTDSSIGHGSVNNEETEKNRKEKRLSKKHLKLKSRPSVMKLKEFAEKPEVVEVWDTTANDPFFYVWLKCVRNSVPVPQHWCVKRKYMHGKRGIEKMPYVLPHYIEDTKISEIRQSIREREEQKSTKQKMRDRVRPKLHTMDIDYQTLHDAFFKYATKPKLVKFGDLYYEGKELQLQTKKFRPGVISEKLRKALNIGVNDPLPWIRNMQKYGTPPSFPFLQIKGVNYFPNEEIKPQTPATDDKPQFKCDNVDSSGSIVYGTFISNTTFGKYPENFFWGELEREESEESEDEEADEKEKEKEKEEKQEVSSPKKEGEGDIEDETSYEKMYGRDISAQKDMYKMANVNGTYSVATNSKMSGTYTPFMEGGLMSVDLTSFIPGYETPKYIDPGKWNSSNIKPYKILQTEEVPVSQKALFASTVKYKINSSNMKNNDYSSNDMSRNANMPEGFQTPFTTEVSNTPFTPFENVTTEKGKMNPSVYSSSNTHSEQIKELNKFENVANRVKIASTPVDPLKKEKKEEKKKKKKKDFKF